MSGMAMGAARMTLDLARWQFALTSINHFFFVPVTIGLAFLVAMLQTSFYRTGKPEFLRLTRFFGTFDLAGVRRDDLVGGVHPDGELVDAASGRLSDGARAAAAHQYLDADD
jgi:hypothetical protein